MTASNNIETLLRANGIIIDGFTPGKHYTTCPMCSGGKRRRLARRLSRLHAAAQLHLHTNTRAMASSQRQRAHIADYAGGDEG
jgi:hypothetical protein